MAYPIHNMGFLWDIPYNTNEDALIKNFPSEFNTNTGLMACYYYNRDFVLKNFDHLGHALTKKAIAQITKCLQFVYARVPDDKTKELLARFARYSALDRFVIAQEGAGIVSDVTYEQALQEIKNGSKVSHWIWYIFPQMKGLGHSKASDYYGLSNREEAKFYSNHYILGPRLEEISQAYLDTGKEAHLVFGSDTEKFRNCMVLFASMPTYITFKKVCEYNHWLYDKE